MHKLKPFYARLKITHWKIKAIDPIMLPGQPCQKNRGNCRNLEKQTIIFNNVNSVTNY